MSLTKDDLTAIQKVVKTTVQPMIDELVEDKATGFAEVHEGIDGLKADLTEVKADLTDTKDTVGRIELQQRSMVETQDRHNIRLSLVEQKVGIA